MTDRKQFEAMLEALINDDQETAKDIFHNIVVAKSREIYEELLSEDFDLNEKAEEDKEEDKEDKEDKEVDESYDEDMEEASDEEAKDDGDVGGDATDDFIDDVEDKDGSEEEPAGDEEGAGEEEIEDRVMDLEDALEELKAEFEQLMAGEEGEPEMGADDMGDMDAMGGEPAGDMALDMPKAEDEFSKFMEYVDKVALPKHGDNGANAKSVVAGKNDMGGTTANIAKGGESKSEGTKGGLLNPSTKEDNAGNVNVPGAKSATKLSSVSAGHGAEKKGKGESPDNKKSIVGSR